MLNKTYKEYSLITHLLFYIAGILYCISLLIILKYNIINFNYSWLPISIFGIIIASLPYKNKKITLFNEYSFIIILQIILYIFGCKTYLVFYSPLVVLILASLSYKIENKIIVFINWIIMTLWIFSVYYLIKKYNIDLIEILIILFNTVLLTISSITVFSRSKIIPKNVDVILCSYTGNTAHYNNLFIDGIKKQGNKVNIFRFHYYKDFKPDLTGDSLVISFPIFGCKPPHQLLDYLIFKLQNGKGKPAFILYTSFGGSENAGILVWFILTLKGYRVIGRNSGIYPMNVNFLRQGPKKIWSWIDLILPTKNNINNQMKTGENFAKGLSTGLPFILLPSPFFLITILFENKHINVLIKNYIFKKRCNGCGICINFCPSERLKMVNGYPKSKGTCTICFGCVNICPKNAMRLSFISIQFKNTYDSKYKKYIIKNKKDLLRLL
jgi:ferredoxin